VIVEIADAVAAAINDGTYAETVNAERAYRPSFDLEELGELKVTGLHGGRRPAAARGCRR